MSAETSPSHSSCLPTLCPNTDFISCSTFKKLLHFFQEYAWSPWSFIHFLNKKYHFLKSVVLRGILNFTGVRKLTSAPHNLVLPGCHHSEVTPFTTSLNDIVQLRLRLQPIPHPAKATAAQEQPSSGLLDFPHPPANQGLVLTVAVVSTYRFPSPFHRWPFAFQYKRKKTETAAAQSQRVSRKRGTEAEEIGTTLILPEQDSQYFITLSNSSVKPFTTVESETPDLSKGNWKNTPLCKGLIKGLSQNDSILALTAQI